MIIPRLSQEALEEVEEAHKKNRIVFHRLPSASQRHECSNCRDLGYNIISVAIRGPYQFVPDAATITWFDGDHRARKGWYVIRTMEFPCPICQVGTQLPPKVKEGHSEQQQEIPF